ncbi:LysR family transcriptional regulator [Noviherbaspirillum suwonense]|jgi:DNA-binding transcriptional LysR family regulator|uniref:DNA-binding transcriptional regulator, LysR family n=1 Tax=Noviherbaspirillum suwonense TaxID=1224511 RepID=A0ABY1QB22_9BURK|nr:LysR family transcriptional regulator [Noviherbaspirillum suwonense]SMP63770.1 DNA-binding transcriptional regulator, LysR family [Noviherbaspirillum suwonense]
MNGSADATSNITLRQLRAFIMVADAGGFAAASHRLHLTPSALSLLIKEMEKLLKVRLFDRTTRNTVLSQSGIEFYPLAKKVLDDLGRAVESTRDLEQKKRGTVRVACTPLYASTLLPELILRYREQYPAIDVHILDSLNQPAVARVASGEADIGIVPQRPSPPEVVQESLLKDRMTFICRPDHPLAARKRVKWEEVLREPVVSLTQDFTTRLQADLFKHSSALVLSPAHSVSFITTALGMVQWGHGVTAQPESVIPLLAPFGLVARPLHNPVVFRHLSLFYKRGYELSPAAKSFREFLHQHAAGFAPPEGVKAAGLVRSGEPAGASRPALG